MIYSIYKKRAIEDLKNLKITQLSWKDINKLTVASGFSQISICSRVEYPLPPTGKPTACKFW